MAMECVITVRHPVNQIPIVVEWVVKMGKVKAREPAVETDVDISTGMAAATKIPRQPNQRNPTTRNNKLPVGKEVKIFLLSGIFWLPLYSK